MDLFLEIIKCILIFNGVLIMALTISSLWMKNVPVSDEEHEEFSAAMRNR